MELPEKLRRNRGKLVVATLIIVLAVVGFFLLPRENWSWNSFIEYGKSLPATWFLLAFLLLPLIGVPISIFLVLVGIRFGFAGGMAITAAAMFFHNFAVYHITHSWFRKKVRDCLDSAGYAIPPIKKKHQVWFTALFAAIHGPPYWAKLYLLALTDIPFRIYFWVGTPIYIVFCVVPVGAGSAATNLNTTLIYILIGITIAITVGGFWLRKRYAGRLEAPSIE